MPCCHVGLTGPFANQFTSDAQRFSAYVGGAPNLPQGATGPELISALHVDLKLWQPARVPIGRPYRINDAFGNAWKAARPQRSPDPFAGHPSDRQWVENAVFDLPQPPAGCVLSVFDQWILDTIIQIRGLALSLAGGVPLRSPTPCRRLEWRRRSSTSSSNIRPAGMWVASGIKRRANL